MAGSELFIQPILQENLSVVPGLAENIASMTEQLNQTTQIMMDLLGHQGLSQNQAAFVGAALAALTLSGDTENYNCMQWNGVTQTSGYPKFVNGSLYLKTSQSPYTGKIEIHDADLTDITDIKFSGTFWTKSGALVFDDGTQIAVSSKDTYYTIPSAQRRRQKKIVCEFLDTLQNSSEKTFAIPTVKLTNGTTKALFAAPFFSRGVGFNSNNVLTYKAVSGEYPGAVVQIDTRTVFLTIPDQAAVAEWSTCVLAKSDAIGAALVDATTHDVLITLPAATNAINQLKEYTNLALMLVFPGDGDASKHLSNFVLRYF